MAEMFSNPGYLLEWISRTFSRRQGNLPAVAYIRKLLIFPERYADIL